MPRSAEEDLQTEESSDGDVSIERKQKVLRESLKKSNYGTA
jgi:hypothetical protein